MNKAAQSLGRLAKGVPKTLTVEQRKFRSVQLAAARKKRHEKTKRIVPSQAELREVFRRMPSQPRGPGAGFQSDGCDA
jgi:hypothetical protein